MFTCICSSGGVAVIGGLVYAVGGFNGSLRVRTVDVYEPLKDAWSSIASMEARRSTLGAAVLNGYIYAVGGFDGSSGLCYFFSILSVERLECGISFCVVSAMLCDGIQVQFACVVSGIWDFIMWSVLYFEQFYWHCVIELTELSVYLKFWRNVHVVDSVCLFIWLVWCSRQLIIKMQVKSMLFDCFLWKLSQVILYCFWLCLCWKGGPEDISCILKTTTTLVHMCNEITTCFCCYVCGDGYMVTRWHDNQKNVSSTPPFSIRSTQPLPLSPPFSRGNW